MFSGLFESFGIIETLSVKKRKTVCVGAGQQVDTKRHTLRIDLNEYRVNTLRRYPDHFEHDKIDGGVLTVTLPPLGYAVWTEA